MNDKIKNKLDKLIEFYNSQIAELNEKEGKPIAYFDVLTECPHDIQTKYVVANYIRKQLDAVYADSSMRWQVVGYKDNIVLAYGIAKFIPIRDIPHKDYIEYSHFEEYDYVSINLPSMTFYEAKLAFMTIFQNLKDSGR